MNKSTSHTNNLPKWFCYVLRTNLTFVCSGHPHRAGSSHCTGINMGGNWLLFLWELDSSRQFLFPPTYGQSQQYPAKNLVQQSAAVRSGDRQNGAWIPSRLHHSLCTGHSWNRHQHHHISPGKGRSITQNRWVVRNRPPEAGDAEPALPAVQRSSKPLSRKCLWRWVTHGAPAALCLFWHGCVQTSHQCLWEWL